MWFHILMILVILWQCLGSWSQGNILAVGPKAVSWQLVPRQYPCSWSHGSILGATLLSCKEVNNVLFGVIFGWLAEWRVNINKGHSYVIIHAILWYILRKDPIIILSTWCTCITSTISITSLGSGDFRLSVYPPSIATPAQMVLRICSYYW